MHGGECAVMNRDGNAQGPRKGQGGEGCVESCMIILHPETDWHSSSVTSKQVLRKLVLGKVSREHQHRFCAVSTLFHPR